MYLYEKDKKEISVYELIPNDEKIKKFKEDEMRTQENIFYRAITYGINDSYMNRIHKHDTAKKIFENITSATCMELKK